MTDSVSEGDATVFDYSVVHTPSSGYKKTSE